MMMAEEQDISCELGVADGDINLEDLSVVELERHRKWLEKRVLQATAAARANHATASLHEEVLLLSYEEAGKGCASSQDRIMQLRQDIQDATAQLNLKERVVETISLSQASSTVLASLDRGALVPCGSGNGDGQEQVADETHVLADAKEILSLVSEQADLSSRCLLLETRARQLEDQCLETRMRMSSEEFNLCRKVSELRVQSDKNGSVDADQSSTSAMKEGREVSDRLHRYQVRTFALQHILQLLITSSGLEASETDRWIDSVLECGQSIEGLT